MCGLRPGGKRIVEYVGSVAAERFCVPLIGRASMTDKQVENHRTSCMMMMLAFWCCILTVYLYIRGLNVLGVCNSTSAGFLEEEAVELTNFGFTKVYKSSLQPHPSGSREIAAQC